MNYLNFFIRSSEVTGRPAGVSNRTAYKVRAHTHTLSDSLCVLMSCLSLDLF